ncbi:MAG: 16S rRNA (cytidine(1402)-2'-O)-methyltransferase [Pseudomonadales bacterium]|nr:16S rRNA (cytidine(1402)-2'-O)-methyltransferase [Pseudomonadales bacterium]MDP6316039.1 16S rRNA (cytidine(1402)-2'-O)-methyltransferase [Pseudomonadales bacterium]MDP7313965.1 16S rRNA (cytidine(1402)-2'-O)-methyltransferase [Pseudomonadales bacterium]MDP7577270.1 16S rRNA (cytidine(1402)-2'-O)-methyltransferase [Pseudomonadales bacterium]
MSLYIVATPIGNLKDISKRALEILEQVDLIAAEDTRHSGQLLQNYSITTNLVAYHDHNEVAATDMLINKLVAGIDVALISDAGTPLVSDPGYRLVKAAHEHGVEVVPIPGASALLAALSASGLATDRFSFEGFLPTRKAARQARLGDLKQKSRTLVFFESPHRIEKMLDDLVDIFGSGRLATIAREMTKRFEQISHGELGTLREKLSSEEIVIRGEFVVVVSGANENKFDYDELKLMKALLEELPPGKAANVAHKLTGVAKKYYYDLALTLKSEK